MHVAAKTSYAKWPNACAATSHDTEHLHMAPTATHRVRASGRPLPTQGIACQLQHGGCFPPQLSDRRDQPVLRCESAMCAGLMSSHDL